MAGLAIPVPQYTSPNSGSFFVTVTGYMANSVGANAAQCYLRWGTGTAPINGAALAGAGRIIAIDMVLSKLQSAKKLGATDTVNAADGDPVKQVMEMTKGGVHYSFECLGAKATAEQAFRMLMPGGTATIVGMIPVGTKIELHGPDFLRELKIQGSAMGSNRFRVDMPRLVEFYMQGKLDLDHMISGHMKLEQINEGFATMKTGKIVRQVIAFN
jgi:S-(hydroxymethyl)glutathione dehydrogenase/alcohol dehydrogenase